jgi:hypothetical protein
MSLKTQIDSLAIRIAQEVKNKAATNHVHSDSTIVSVDWSKITNAPSGLTSISWNAVTDKPATLGGFGIVDAVPKNSAVTITANHDWNSTGANFPQHYYHNRHTDNTVYQHYYPNGTVSGAAATDGVMRVWGGSSAYELKLSGVTGKLTWLGSPVLTENTFSSYALPITGGTLYASLNISSATPTLILRDTNNADTGQLGYISLQNSSSTETGWIGFGEVANTDLTVINLRGTVVLNPEGVTRTNILNVNGDLTVASSKSINVGATIITDSKILMAAGSDFASFQYVTPSNDTAYLMISTGDNSDEPIYFAQSGNIRVMIDSDGALKTGSGYKFLNEADTGVIRQRLNRIHADDGTKLSTRTALETGFTYGVEGEPSGPYITFGGLDLSVGYTAQLVGEYYGGGNNFKIRTHNGDTSTWNPWRTLLTDGNYNSYSPTLGGAGASGTWNISISGIANQASEAISAGKVYSRGNKDASSWGNTRGESGINMYNVYANGYPVTYGNVIHVGGGGAGQLLIGWSGSDGTHADNFIRSKRDNDSGAWSPWAKILTNVNYNNDVPSLTGANASGTWGISITGNAANTSSVSNAVGGSYTWTAINYFRSNFGASSSVNNQSGYSLEAYSTDNGAAGMSFHRAGQYAINMGLDPDNVFRIGGWLAPSNLLQLNMSGDLQVLGSVSASGIGGFRSMTYAVGARNPIWRFANADGYGISYFQGTAGFDGASDTFGIHFGTATSTSSNFSFSSNGVARVIGDGFTDYGPNSTWGGNIRVGGNGRTATDRATIVTTNGNLHMDAKDGMDLYLNYYSRGSVIGPNGAMMLNENNCSSYVNHLGGIYYDRYVRGDNNTCSINTNTVEGGVGANNLTRSCFFRDNGAQYGALGVHVSHATDPNYAFQLVNHMYGDVQLGVRYKSAGTWGPDVRLIQSNNYTIWVPSKTGDGASGTWGINISGTAANSTRVFASVSGTNVAELVRGDMADNDQFRIAVGGNSSNAGWAEIATGDDGTEPIYVRQYTGVFTSLVRTLTLLDANGNTSVPGSFYAASNITAYSDARIKTKLEKIEGALDKVDQLTGYTFDRTDIETSRQTGLIAQDVQKVLPEAVSEHDDKLSVAYGNMMGLIVEAIKELRAEVAEIKATINNQSNN